GAAAGASGPAPDLRAAAQQTRPGVPAEGMTPPGAAGETRGEGDAAARAHGIARRRADRARRAGHQHDLVSQAAHPFLDSKLLLGPSTWRLPPPLAGDSLPRT